MRKSNLLVASAAALALGVAFTGSAFAAACAPAKVVTKCIPVVKPNCAPPTVVTGRWVEVKSTKKVCKPEIVKVKGEWVCPPPPKDECIKPTGKPICVTLPQPVTIRTVCVPQPVMCAPRPVCKPVCATTPVCGH